MRAYLDELFLDSLTTQKVDVVFLDRDGVINKRMPPHQHVIKWEQFVFLPGVYESLKKCSDNNFLVVLITNQRCVALGSLSEQAFLIINNKMIEKLKAQGIHIEGVYYCPHDEKAQCDCRKPKIGLYKEFESDLLDKGLTINKGHSWMIGDELTDIEAGKAYGVKTILIKENSGPALSNAIDHIINERTCLLS